jgi:predicted helicase
MHTRGVQTTRDAWCFHSSKDELWQNIIEASDAYNQYAMRRDGSATDARQFSWCQKTRKAAKDGKRYQPARNRIFLSDFRPFVKSWLYTDNFLNWSAYKTAALFPSQDVKNLAIGVPSRGFRGGFSTLMCSTIPGLYFASTDCSEFFPLYVYDTPEEKSGGLFEGRSSSLQRRDAITDAGLAHFQAAYPGKEITKEDIFYYVYGLLHSQDYRDRYADNLSKELPRIPCVKTYADFSAFSDAGRRLCDLHVNYETVEPCPVMIKQGDLRTAVIKDPEAFYRVTKMKFAGKRGGVDKSTVIYNANITMQNIPLEAYDYVVNGKPALEWVMERQVVKTDKASGIVNDANRYAIETMNNPAYPLELFQRVITVSLVV